MLSSVIAAGYYLRLIYIMWFREPGAPFLSTDISVKAVVGITAASTIVLLIFIGQLDHATELAASGVIQ